MLQTNKRIWAKVVFTFLATGVLGLILIPLAYGGNLNEGKPVLMHRDNVKKLQESLRDKGQYSGKIDGILGPKTRAGIRQYQKSENLPVTGRLDSETNSKLGIGPESVGVSFKDAGQEAGKGGAEMGHEMKKGKPIAAGKELGKGLGRAGTKVGEAVKKAVSTESDRGDQEKK